MIKVGNKIPDDPKVRYTYRDVKYDPDGWADAKKYLPMDYDLCFVLTENKKVRSGWVSGSNFDGAKLKKDEKIIAWKMRRDGDEN